MYNKQFRRTVLFLAAYAIFTLVCAIPCRSAFTFRLWCGVTSVLELYAAAASIMLLYCIRKLASKKRKITLKGGKQL